ncbi:MAG: S8 family serine peptidase [Candidatus Omnitrophica bacterium]|nr:S8 family serine peptidase [Candidatus Omnitrophota bacterium]
MKIRAVAVIVFFFAPFSAFAQSEAKIAGLCRCATSLTKLTSDVLKMNWAVEEGETALSAMQRCAPFAMREGKLQSIVGASGASDDLINACMDAGLTVHGVHSAGNLHQIVVRCEDPVQLILLAEHPDVLGITTAPYALSMVGSIENEADLTIQAKEAREVFGVDGSGVRIGVLSDSIADQSESGRIFDDFFLGAPSQLKLELPKKIRVLDLGDGTGNDEAAAMMELMHDLAPGADFSFAAVRYDYAAFAPNIRKLWTDPGYECDILVDDISFLKEPIYQHGPIAAAAMEAAANGVPYFSAAGNFNNNAHERPYVDASPEDDDSYPPGGEDFHDFGAAYGLASDTHLSLHLPRYSTVILSLHWDEPYGGVLAEGKGAESDLDLYLVSDETTPLRNGAGGNILASSVDFQGSEGNPGGEPVEFLYYVNTDADRDVHVVIDHQGGRRPERLHLYVVFEEINGNHLIDRRLVQDRTLIGHMAAPAVISVAAAHYREIDRNGEYTEPIEQMNVTDYSALGGELPILFSDDGLTRYETPIVVFKPDVTGPDNTSTSVAGFESFSGTSAAASNVAAVAALMLQYDPTLDPNNLLKSMQLHSIDLCEEGPDYRSGAGLVNAFRALSSLNPSRISFWERY